MCKKHYMLPRMFKNMSTMTKMWIGIAVLALLSPIGIIIPDKVKAGAAWGEWGTEEIEKMLGYVPQGMKRVADVWRAPLPDYDFKGWEQIGLGMQSLAYIFSALVGVALIVSVILLLGKIATKK